ncbi:major facilitator superfamily transporter [Stemphylium lycopersici]|uniref:Major facilitator superfamily transporter n=1 Tax=Stemphylium lycopersici TaxID=183478 RepID=A0A364MRU1_STELY|nr:major facilitator superfamily transporter [Stemphylium lycopersici]RAQ98765.1 major facilitator superfamily transporter [Stemphylium lycopersici]RAR01116.1 major facilitator superfamily transporter [Stemphylium lycopersici]
MQVWFSVRARALGSFLSGIIAVTCGNLLGAYLDRTSIPLRTRTRTAFWVIAALQGAWWLWATVLVTEFRSSQPTYDWASPGFGRAFAVFIFLAVGFQINYLFLYFIVGNLATDQQEVIRYAALLRGSESAWQAISYGITSVTIFAEVGAVYWNFALLAMAIPPAWLVLREFGGDKKNAIEQTGDGIVNPSPKVDGVVLERADKAVDI